MKLSEVPTQVLIKELRRRKRLFVVDANQIYHAEQADDIKYTQHLEHQLALDLGHLLHRRGTIRFTDYEGIHRGQRVRGASLIVLISQRTSDALVAEGVRGLSAAPGGVPSDDAADPSVASKKSLDAAR